MNLVAYDSYAAKQKDIGAREWIQSLINYIQEAPREELLCAERRNLYNAKVCLSALSDLVNDSGYLRMSQRARVRDTLDAFVGSNPNLDSLDCKMQLLHLATYINSCSVH